LGKLRAERSRTRALVYPKARRETDHSASRLDLAREAQA
jgi:hypothetical protein